MPEMRMNSLKSRAMNCGPLSEMIRGRASGCFSLAAWRIISISGLPHGAAEAIQHAAQVVKRPRDVDITHVDMPMLMRLRSSPGTEVGLFLAEPGLSWHGALSTANTGAGFSSTNL